MSYWNYRILKCTNGMYQLHEVVYNEKSEIVDLFPIPEMQDENLDGLKRELEFVGRAASREILQEQDIDYVDEDVEVPSMLPLAEGPPGSN